MRDSQIILSGGRTLAYAEIGEPDWPCLLFFHGAPMSRLHLSYLEEDFLAAGCRVISPDRPGYGASSPVPGRSMADWPADVEALADALGIERFVVAGHSSGGPYAVACAALLPQRVAGGAIFAGVTDMAWPGAWDGFSAVESRVMRMPGEAAAIAWCVQHFGADGEGFHEASDFEFAAPDTALFIDEQAGPVIAATAAEAFRQGVAGYAQDVFVQGRPWPFDPGVISAPIRVLHGELDTAVPVAHSRHTAALIPGATFEMLSGHGHMTAVSELPGVAAELAFPG